MAQNISFHFILRLTKINARGSDRSVTHLVPHPYLLFPSELQLLLRLSLELRSAEDAPHAGKVLLLGYRGNKLHPTFIIKLGHNSAITDRLFFLARTDHTLDMLSSIK